VTGIPRQRSKGGSRTKVVLNRISGTRYHEPSAQGARRRVVAFFIGIVPVSSAPIWQVTRILAVDQGGRVIAQCTPGAPPVGDCRDTR
jgi:hypothetical protein